MRQLAHFAAYVAITAAALLAAHLLGDASPPVQPPPTHTTQGEP